MVRHLASGERERVAGMGALREREEERVGERDNVGSG